MQQFINHSLVSVIYYGSNKTEEEYQNYTSVIPKFFLMQMRFGHTFNWELRKKYLAQLPCVEIHNQSGSEESVQRICNQELTKENIEKHLNESRPKLHKAYDKTLNIHWFLGTHANIFVYMYNEKPDPVMRKVFHQFIHNHTFENKIAEVDVSRVRKIPPNDLERRISACREVQDRHQTPASRHFHPREAG